MNDLTPAEIEALSRAMGNSPPSLGRLGAESPLPKNSEKKPLPIETLKEGVSRLQLSQLKEDVLPASKSYQEQEKKRMNEVPLQLEVLLGKTKIPLEQLLKLQIGQVIALDTLAGELVEVQVNGIPIAKGEIVVIEEENFGIRLLEFLEKPSP